MYHSAQNPVPVSICLYNVFLCSLMLLPAFADILAIIVNHGNNLTQYYSGAYTLMDMKQKYLIGAW